MEIAEKGSREWNVVYTSQILGAQQCGTLFTTDIKNVFLVHTIDTNVVATVAIIQSNDCPHRSFYHVIDDCTQVRNKVQGSRTPHSLADSVC